MSSFPINGAKFDDKMLRVKTVHIKASLSEIPGVFRSCFILKRRQFCMATKQQNELLRTENANENSKDHDQEQVGKIRWFCKAETSPHEVANFFNQLRNLPVKHRTRSLNSALYWFLYYGKTKEALELNSLWEAQGSPKSYSTYASLAILYARCRQLGNKRDFFHQMKLNGFTPRARHYEPFLAAAIIRGDLMEVFESLSEMEHSSIIHEMSLDLYTLLIRACTGKEHNLLDNNVFQIFHYFMKYRTKLTDDALHAIRLWFDRRSQTQWITSWTIASPTFHCPACKQKLETGEFSKEELEDLKLSLVKHLWKPHKTLQQLKCFTSAGNFIDYVNSEQLNRIPLSVEHFVKNTGPYDVVIDGLNVGYIKGFFDPRNIQNVVSHFVKKRKRVLVVGSSPLRLSERTKKGKQTPLGSLVEYLTVHEQCGLISLPECSLDDLYFLSAAMHCKPGTLLVSNDKFHDHKYDIDPLVRIHFNRWQRLNKLTLKGFVDESPLFVRENGCDPAVQTNGDTWHFPSSDGNRWLCVQKAKT